MYYMNIGGLRMKTTMKAAIYKKVLSLSNSSRRVKTGEESLPFKNNSLITESNEHNYFGMLYQTTKC